jgi:hypothetical protein
MAIDPENRFLARGPRRRLDAEVIRDQALAVAGILNRTLGGPSVKTYQPPGLWKSVGLQGSNTSEFKRDGVEKLHRRSLYTFWKRTSIPPNMSAFNAPTREACTVRRERTNTPLQALVLMNDEQFIEAARKLAETLLAESPDQNLDQRASEAFLRAVGRPANEADVNDMKGIADDAQKHFLSHPEKANQLNSVGALPIDQSLDPIQVATLTTVISVLFNRDDVINQN